MNEKTFSYELINSLTFCVFDLETTGGNQEKDKIIEIGLVKISKLSIVEKKCFLIRPEVNIPDFIQKLTSIRESDVVNAPTIEEVIDEILDFMGDSILVAHNTSFDVPFFNSVLKRLNRPLIENKSICTNLMTKYMMPHILNSNLNYMSSIFQLNHHKAHRALDDAQASAELLLKYLNIFIKKNITKVNSLYYPKNKFELDRIHYKKNTSKVGHHDNVVEEAILKIKTIKTPFLAIFKGNDGTVLFSFPSHGTIGEQDYLIRKIKQIPFELLTLKLTGPYLKGIIELASFFSKIDHTWQNEIIKELLLFNEMNLGPNEESSLEILPPGFIITNHLIPEQYYVSPVQHLHSKLDLVFRFPAHQNKLVQFLNSKFNKINSGKVKGDFLHPLIYSFMREYLKSKNDFLFIEFPKSRLKLEDIENKILQFIEANPNKYNFPTFHL